MKIIELLNSTNSFGNSRSIKGILSQKDLGNIYAKNKEVRYNPKQNEVEISMYFGANSQKDMNLHRATVCLKNIRQEVFNRIEIVDYVKNNLGLELTKLAEDYFLSKVHKNLGMSDNVSKQFQDFLKAREKFEAPKDIRVKAVDGYSKYEGRKESGSEPTYDDYEDIIKEYNIYVRKARDLEKEAQFLEIATRGRNPEKLPEDIIRRKKKFDEDNQILADAWNRLELKLDRYKGLDVEKLKRKSTKIDVDDKGDIPKIKIIDTTRQYRMTTIEGHNIMTAMGEGFRRTDEYKQRYKEFMESLPDDIVIEIIKQNPFLVKNKIITQYDKIDSFLVVDNRISLDADIRVNCSCFTGDTRVQLANGTILTLKDLKNMTYFKVLAYNTETGNYEYARALNCTKRQENAKIMKITLADGTSIRVTPSHRFLNSNCEWKQAQDLKVGDLLKFNYKYWGYKNHEQHTSSSTFIYLDPTQEGDYQFGELKFTHKPFYVGITTGAYVKIENERCLDYLNDLADKGVQPLMFKQYYHVDEHVALQLKEKLVNRIGTIDNGSVLVNNQVQVNDNFINENDDCIAVTSIEELEEREDVYCLTVEGLGNFALKTEKGNIIVENCADYYWTFAWANFTHKVHKGRKPPVYFNTYLRGYAIRNPKNSVGCCKHLIVFLLLLMQEGFLDKREGMVKDFQSAKNADNFKIINNQENLQKPITDMIKNLREFNANARVQGRLTREEIGKIESGHYDLLNDSGTTEDIAGWDVLFKDKEDMNGYDVYKNRKEKIDINMGLSEEDINKDIVGKPRARKTQPKKIYKYRFINGGYDKLINKFNGMFGRKYK